MNPEQPQQPYQSEPGYQAQQPYGYAQPGYPPQQQYASAPNAGVWGTSSMGNMGAHTMAGLAYVLTFIPTIGFFIPIVLFFIEKNRFAKFHAAQASVLNVGAVILFVVLGILGGVFAGLAGAAAAATNSSAGGGIFGLLVFGVFGCLFPIIGIGLLVLLIMGAIAGFQGQYRKLPIVGDLAERLSGGPITPGMPNLP